MIPKVIPLLPKRAGVRNIIAAAFGTLLISACAAQSPAASSPEAPRAASAVASTAPNPAILAALNSYVTLLAQNRLDEWIELWADDAVMEYPFAPKGRKSTYKGKKEILEYTRGTAGKIRINKMRALHVQQMLDPNMAVVETSIDGTLLANGAPYNQQYITVLQLKNGKLWRYREYWNPLISIEACKCDIQTWAGQFGFPE